MKCVRVKSTFRRRPPQTTVWKVVGLVTKQRPCPSGTDRVRLTSVLWSRCQVLAFPLTHSPEGGTLTVFFSARLQVELRCLGRRSCWSESAMKEWCAWEQGCCLNACRRTARPGGHGRLSAHCRDSASANTNPLRHPSHVRTTTLCNKRNESVAHNDQLTIDLECVRLVCWGIQPSHVRRFLALADRSQSSSDQPWNVVPWTSFPYKASSG